MEGMGISKHARVLVQTGAKPRRLVGSTPRRPLRTRRREPLPDKGDGGLHKDTKGLHVCIARCVSPCIQHIF